MLLASFPKRRGPRVHLVTLGLWTYSFWFSVATDGLVVQWAVSCWATFWWSWEWDDNWASYCQLFEVIILVHQNNEDRSAIGNWLTALPPLSVCLFVSETGLAAQLGRPRTHDHSAFWIVELSYMCHTQETFSKVNFRVAVTKSLRKLAEEEFTLSCGSDGPWSLTVVSGLWWSRTRWQKGMV